MSRHSIAAYLDQYENGRCSYDKLLFRVKKHSLPVKRLRWSGCLYIYLRQKDFRFGIHLFIPLILIRPVLFLIGAWHQKQHQKRHQKRHQKQY